MTKRAVVVERLARGDLIHMQIRGGRRQWWFEEPRADVTDATMQQVLADGSVGEAFDSLFRLPGNSQTWMVDETYGDAP